MTQKMLALCRLLCMEFHLWDFKSIEHPPIQPCINENKQGDTDVQRRTKHHSAYLACVSFSCFHFLDKMPWKKSNTGEEMDYLTYTSRLQPMVAEKPERQEVEIAHHITSMRKKEMNAPLLPACCAYPTAFITSIQFRALSPECAACNQQ